MVNASLSAKAVDSLKHIVLRSSYFFATDNTACSLVSELFIKSLLSLIKAMRFLAYPIIILGCHNDSISGSQPLYQPFLCARTLAYCHPLIVPVPPRHICATPKGLFFPNFCINCPILVVKISY